MIAGDRISLEYRSGKTQCWAVRDVSIRVVQGEFAIVVGPSGSGKSSLLYLLSGLRNPSSGVVSYSGKSYRGLTAGELSRLRYEAFGFVFQQHFLVPYLTSVENVCLGRRKALRERACAVLRYLGLGGKERSFPAQLSYGERQRVAVARALVHNPKVVFADEPTASVDSELAGKICRWLREYCAQGHTCIMATHDPQLITNADTVYHMRDGGLN